MEDKDQQPTEEQIKKTEQDIKDNRRIFIGSMILRILWTSVVLWWLIRSCNN